MFIDGMYLSPATDYAEMFEMADGLPIDVGYFVTVAQEDRIRKATSADDFIIGITSATPSFVGNSAGLRWQDKYVTDEWGRKQYHEVTLPGTPRGIPSPSQKARMASGWISGTNSCS
ncbi:hypothetical protein A8L34_01295 [Bacillus sp. FJAT-27264]|uniref:peptidase G2 autoproteolytic cleavage domain-containing protein n=1 Tax=Paenibacillus sp. (strain DSM 101736 / FJAT-27264) TaxID=1850362 RepID=UPI000807AA90|nr:peptidase G2 autoproteolytic cleavage domain-containing protein [Bacillus sp. FJAT-27264]OBZ18252.1 hypothetical protein A8L34_01295 [Bacillus sp. FJAT-27264]